MTNPPMTRVPPRDPAARRLGRPHFAFLRAIVEGIATRAAAERYLGADGAAEAREAHHAVVDALRSVALRQGEAVWAQLAEGVELRRPRAARPSLDAWAEAAGIDPAEWGEAELLAMYHEAHPPGEAAQAEARTNAAERRSRLELLRTLEARVGEAALPEHALEGWFDPQTAERLRGAGVATLGELQVLIARGGRWYSAMDAIGPAKATAIVGYLEQLLPALPPIRFESDLAGELAALGAPEVVDAVQEDRSRPAQASADAPLAAAGSLVPAGAAQPVEIVPDEVALTAQPAPAVDPAHARVAAEILPADKRQALAAAGLDGRHGTNRVAAGGLPAYDDVDAAAAWLCARTGVPGEKGYVATTAGAYRQQLRRLLLWCMRVRQTALSSMTSADCAAYMAFLADIPDTWISKTRAPFGSERWYPFAGQLSPSSREQALRTLSGLFEWLVHDAKYLQVNPWRALKLRQPDDPGRRPRASRAFTPAAWAALQAYLEHPDMASPGTGLQARQRHAERARMGFVLAFNEACGLRATELVQARRGDLEFDGEAWTLHVHGKGSKNREVELPPQAVRALQAAFRARGWPSFEQAPPDAPLVTQLLSKAPLTYSSFYDAFRAFVRAAVAASTLDAAERAVALKASTHWMRHTAAERLSERGVDPRVIQDQLGHAHLDTTMNYLKTLRKRRRAQIAAAFS